MSASDGERMSALIDSGGRLSRIMRGAERRDAWVLESEDDLLLGKVFQFNAYSAHQSEKQYVRPRQ